MADISVRHFYKETTGLSTPAGFQQAATNLPPSMKRAFSLGLVEAFSASIRCLRSLFNGPSASLRRFSPVALLSVIQNCHAISWPRNFHI